MSLVDMKRTKQEEVKNVGDCTVEELYPYGLRLHLSSDDIKKLGMKELPSVGTKVRIEAVAEVCNVSMYETKNGEEKNMGMQITNLEIEPASEKKSKAESLYGDND